MARVTLEDQATDVLGELTEVTADELVVQTRSGPARLSRSAVIAGRTIPPPPVRGVPPHRSPSIADLQDIMATHWLPRDREQHGLWLLRAAQGFTARANSALVAHDPAGAPDAASLHTALDAVRTFYAQRGLPPTLALPTAVPGGAPDPDGAHARRAASIHAAGWADLPEAGALVMTARLDALLTPLRHQVDLPEQPDQEWLSLARYRGQELPPVALELITSAEQQVFASVHVGSQLAGVARGSLASGWAAVSSVYVDPQFRRQGIAADVLSSIARWARRTGAQALFLQVGDHNDGAIALYRRLGLEVHHRYDYARETG